MLVGGLVVLLTMGLLQLTLVLHVRNTLTDCASEGARYGALDGNDASDGAARAAELAEQSLSAAYAGEVTARRVERGGVELVEVTMSAPLPLVGLLGPGGRLTVTGHAVAEDALP
ncbi:hypothetical protein CCO02nite_21130 [Cellulomonas composti]|uniref:TadE-like domain-containing protein n=1 Tax=Cellulomonas composti TaxID=266130 RepID=A0A511JBU4_9CELL|nr:hypothetical protein CCO02nite_21130 [Cellulomonas composti]